MAKKIVLSLLSLMLCLSLASAAGVREIGENEKIVKLISVEKSYQGEVRLTALNTDGTASIYNVSAETFLENLALDSISADMVLVIEDTGIATLSIPPQMNAKSIRDITLSSSLGFYDVSFADPVEIVREGENDGLPFDLENLTERFSYSYAYLSMDNLIAQGLVLRGNYLARGLMDAIDTSSETLLSFDEMMMAIEEYYTTVYERRVAGDYGEKINSLSDLDDLSRPDNLEDQFAYSYGYIIALQLLSQGIEIDRVAFPYGMLNRLYNDQALLSTEEMERAVNEYIQHINEAVSAWLKEIADSNLAEAEAYLEENAERDGVDVISEYLQLEFLTRSDEESAMPELSDTVVVNYALRKADGSLIEKNDNASFPLYGVIEGFRTALMNMHVGDSATAYIHPSIGYGETGAGMIGPNQLLIFEIELVSIVE